MVHKILKKTETTKKSFHGIHKVDAKLMKAIEQTKVAYADSQNMPDALMDSPEWKAWEDKVYKKRILQWKGTDYFEPDDWLKLAKIAGQYNEFDPEKVFLVLNQFKGIKVKMARESSVAIYIKYGSNDPKKIEKAMKEFGKADEVHVDRVSGKDYLLFPKKGVMRVWWD